MERMPIDLVHLFRDDPSQPLPFHLTPEESQKARFWQGILELQRMERNVRDYQRDLARS